jgi:hypothetical protein
VARESAKRAVVNGMAGARASTVGRLDSGRRALTSLKANLPTSWSSGPRIWLGKMSSRNNALGTTLTWRGIGSPRLPARCSRTHYLFLFFVISSRSLVAEPVVGDECPGA